MSLFGDIAGFFGAEKAEDAQYAASQQQLQALEKGYNRANTALSPYGEFGQSGMNLIKRLYGLDDGTADMSAFTQSPDYQFRLGEGLKGIQGSAAASGGLFSGAAGKAINNYAQNTASQEFDNYLNRLFGITGIGQNAATGIANAATGNATNTANVYGNIGANQANRIQSQSNAIGGALDEGADALMKFFLGGG